MGKIKWFFSFSLFYLMLSIPTPVQAQEGFLFKIGINKLFSSQYFLGGEFKCFESFSISTEIGLLKKAHYLETIDNQRGIGEISTDQTSDGSIFRKRTKVLTGYQTNIEVRYRPGKDLKEGLYLGVKTGYQFADFGPLEVSLYKVDVFDSPTYSKNIVAQQQSWFLGGTLGFNSKISKNLILDTNIFSGYMYAESIDPTELEFIPYAEPDLNLFRNNHRVPIDQFRVELNIFLNFSFDK